MAVVTSFTGINMFVAYLDRMSVGACKSRTKSSRIRAKRSSFIALVAACFTALPALAQPDSTLPSMKPLSRYIAENDVGTDLVASSYVMARCASYYGIMSYFLSNSNNPEYQISKRAADAAQTRYFNAWFALSKKIDPQVSDSQRRQQIEKMGGSIIKAYSERTNAIRARTGNMFDDPVIKDDAETCRLIHDTILSKF